MILRNLFILAMMGALACTTTQNHRPNAEDLHLGWEFLGNDAVAGSSESVFYLKNSGKQDLIHSGWKLYFSQMHLGVQEESVGGNVGIEHINGDLYCMSPREGFMLKAGEELRISYKKGGRIISECEAPGGLYFVFSEEGKQAVEEPGSFEVLPFPTLDKVYPEGSGVPLPDAAWLYEQNKYTEVKNAEHACPLIPAPLEYEALDGRLFIDKDWHIESADELTGEAAYLGAMLEGLLGKAPASAGMAGDSRTIFLELAGEMEPEAYRLNVDEGGIHISASGGAGVFYGIQSLLALLPPEAWSETNETLEISYVKIYDKPAFEYRGMMLDVARNFQKPATIRKMIDAMALYKLNKLHLGLTNDEAWRIEIPGLPELTEIGGFRGHTESSKDVLIPSYGSGPYPNTERGLGSGFLSREDFVGLIRYAAERHIELIPEVNFPGHARAAIYAMEARYDRLMEEGREEEALRFRLIDPEDKSVYNSAQNFHDNIVCVCQEGPYRFYEKVVDELMGMYEEAGTQMRILHAGGDEVPSGSWTASPVCEDFLTEHPELGEAKDLQAYFGGRILDMLLGKGVTMGGWEEVALLKDEKGKWNPNPGLLGKNLHTYVWNSIGSYLDLGNRVANAGYPVILCNVDNLYFDLAYNHHPSEPGLYWGGYVTTRRALEFSPYHVFNSTLTDRYRNPMEPDLSSMAALKPEARGNIKGIQAQIWAETLRDSEMLEYYYFPRMLALAERSWAGEPTWSGIADREDRMTAMDNQWAAFAWLVGSREMPRLDGVFSGYNYRIPTPGGIIKDGLLHANTAFPGLEIRYTTNGNEPDSESELYQEPFVPEGKVILRSFNRKGRGSLSVEVRNE